MQLRLHDGASSQTIEPGDYDYQPDDLTEAMAWKFDGRDPYKFTEVSVQYSPWPGRSHLIIDRIVVTAIVGISQE